MRGATGGGVMEVAGIALRDIVLVLSGLAGIYLVFLTLRLLQVGRHRSAAHEVELLAPSLAAAAEEEVAEAAAAMPQTRAEAPPPIRSEAASPRFGDELARSHQELELRQLREEVGQLREEVGSLRADLVDLKAARHVSPQYADAMALAQRGLTAQDLADRCGISLGEAELVWALSRGPMNFDQEDDYGGESGHKHARSA